MSLPTLVCSFALCPRVAVFTSSPCGLCVSSFWFALWFPPLRLVDLHAASFCAQRRICEVGFFSPSPFCPCAFLRLGHLHVAAQPLLPFPSSFRRSWPGLFVVASGPFRVCCSFLVLSLAFVPQRRFCKCVLAVHHDTGRRFLTAMGGVTAELLTATCLFAVSNALVPRESVNWYVF